MNGLRTKKWLSFSNLGISCNLDKSPVIGVQGDNKLFEGNLRKRWKAKSVESENSQIVQYVLLSRYMTADGEVKLKRDIDT